MILAVFSLIKIKFTRFCSSPLFTIGLKSLPKGKLAKINEKPKDFCLIDFDASNFDAPIQIMINVKTGPANVESQTNEFVSQLSQTAQELKSLFPQAPQINLPTDV